MLWMLAVGIVGLPNTGKSSLFNALSAGQAEVSNYPFTTIASNLGVVSVPDARLEELKSVVEPDECHPAHIESSTSPAWSREPVVERVSATSS